MIPPLRVQINLEVDRLKRLGVKRFCPVDVGKRLKTDARTVICNIRYRDDIKQISRCSATKREYISSVWGFVEEGK